MHVLGLQKTMRLWDRLERESTEYYQTLHDARNQMRHIGPNVFSDLSATFSDLDREYKRLKQRFIVMTIIGRQWHVAHVGTISDIVNERAVWVFGSAVWSDLLKGSYNVRLR